MKKTLIYLFIPMIIGLTGCFNKTTVSTNKKLKKVETPCEQEGFNTQTAFRASATAKSVDNQTAKNQALLLAKSTLAGNIETNIKSMVDNYISKNNIQDAEQFRQKFEDITRATVKQKLNGVSIICSETYQDEDNNYIQYIAIEMDRENVGKSIYDNISKEQTIKLDYDYTKFKDEMNKELENYDK